MTALTYRQVLESAHRVVAARGRDIIYRLPRCAAACAHARADHLRYPYTAWRQASGAATCGCLVGEILADLHLLTDAIAGSTASIDAIANSRHHRLSVEPDALEFLTVLQAQQDRGATRGTRPGHRAVLRRTRRRGPPRHGGRRPMTVRAQDQPYRIVQVRNRETGEQVLLAVPTHRVNDVIDAADTGNDDIRVATLPAGAVPFTTGMLPILADPGDVVGLLLDQAPTSRRVLVNAALAIDPDVWPLPANPHEPREAPAELRRFQAEASEGDIGPAAPCCGAPNASSTSTPPPATASPRRRTGTSSLAATTAPGQ